MGTGTGTGPVSNKDVTIEALFAMSTINDVVDSFESAISLLRDGGWIEVCYCRMFEWSGLKTFRNSALSPTAFRSIMTTLTSPSAKVLSWVDNRM